MKELNKFMMYASNYRLRGYSNSYGDEHINAPEALEGTNCPFHLADKWKGLCEKHRSGTTAFLFLWYQLDGTNRELLIDWIDVNFEG